MSYINGLRKWHEEMSRQVTIKRRLAQAEARANPTEDPLARLRRVLTLIPAGPDPDADPTTPPGPDFKKH